MLQFKLKRLTKKPKTKIKTVHEGSKWPEEIVNYNEEDIERSEGRNKYLESFIEKHGYKEVWSNKVFSISLPALGNDPNFKEK